MACGLIWDSDIVLLLPLIGSGGVQSNIHHRGSNMAPEPVTGGCVLIQWTEVSCDQKVQWSFSQEDGGQQPFLDLIYLLLIQSCGG